MIITVTKDNFESDVLNAPKPVLLDFWAVWCGPCKMLAPVVDAVAEEQSDVIVGKVDVDAEPELARAFSIASIPTLLLLKDGNVAGKSVGVVPKEKILELIG